jgi:hypothetical protein
VKDRGVLRKRSVEKEERRESGVLRIWGKLWVVHTAGDADRSAG